MIDAEDLKGKQEQLRGIYSEFYRETEIARRYYDLDYAGEVVPSGWQNKLQPLIPPTARWAVDEAVDHVLFTPRIKVQRRPSTAGKVVMEQQVVEKKRKFLDAWWAHVNGTSNILGDARKTLINEGIVVIRKVIRWDLLPEAPGDGPENKKARAEYRRQIAALGHDDFLWDLEIMDNLSVAFDPSNHREPNYFFFKTDIFREEAKRLFPDDMYAEPSEDSDDEEESSSVGPTSAKGKWREGDDLEKVEYSEYWSADNGDDEGRCVKMVGGEVVWDAVNPYCYVPFAIEDAGFGTIRMGSKPEEKFVGMTRYMQPVFRAEATQMTSWEKVAELTAFGLWISRNADPSRVWNIGPGEVIALEGDEGQPGAETLLALKLPEIPAGVIQLIEKTTQMANDSLKMRTLGGQPLAGVETATEADQQIRNASAKLGSVVAAMERIAARMSRWVLMDVDKHIEAPVTIYSAAAAGTDDASITLSPEDIRGYYEVHAELRTTDQEASNMVKARFWGEMYRLFPFLSATTAMERGEITEDPQMELLIRGAEDAFLSDEMKMARVIAALQEVGQYESVIQHMAGPQQPGQGGPTPPSGPSGGGGGFPSEPSAGIGVPAGVNVETSVPRALPGSAGAQRDILQGASQIRG